MTFLERTKPFLLFCAIKLQEFIKIGQCVDSKMIHASFFFLKSEFVVALRLLVGPNGGLLTALTSGVDSCHHTAGLLVEQRRADKHKVRFTHTQAHLNIPHKNKKRERPEQMCMFTGINRRLDSAKILYNSWTNLHTHTEVQHSTQIPPVKES